jgi:arsenate reductase
MRTGEAIYRELNLGRRDVEDAELMDLMVRHPDLIQRPILEIDDRAALGRPIENLTVLLDEKGL